MVTLVQPGDLAGQLRAGKDSAYRLAPGDHPPLSLYGLKPAARVQILGQPGATLKGATLGNCRNLMFRLTKFQAAGTNPAAITGLVTADAASDTIDFDHCEFSTTDDVSGWTAEDWVNRPFYLGLFLRGPNMSAKFCTFRNLRNCLAIGGSNAFVQDNTFRDFGNDGIQFGGNWQYLQRNVIRGGRHTAAEPLHADAMQGMPAPNGGTWSNIIIEDNDIEFAGPGDYMQGIDAFDGRWKNVSVRRNKVKGASNHGISWYGVDGITIEGNTVEPVEGGSAPWIQVSKDKLGKPSYKVTIRKNVAPMVRCDVPDASIAGNVMDQSVTVPATVTATVSR